MEKRKTLIDLINENVKESDVEQIIDLPLYKIKPNPYQPRKDFNDEALKELSLSIKEHGVIQPIIVKESGEAYIIIAGERRFRASQLAGKETIPSIVRGYEKTKMIELALIENLQRQELSSYEEASAYELMMKELNYTQQEVANKVGKSRSYITNMLGILKLPEEVLTMLNLGKISFGHARALSKLSNEKRIIELAHIIIMRNLSVRQIEELVKNEEKTNEQKVKKTNKQIISKNILDNKLKIKIAVDDKKVVIKAKDKEELQDIIKWLMEGK